MKYVVLETFNENYNLVTDKNGETFVTEFASEAYTIVSQLQSGLVIPLGDTLRPISNLLSEIDIALFDCCYSTEEEKQFTSEKSGKELLGSHNICIYLGIMNTPDTQDLIEDVKKLIDFSLVEIKEDILNPGNIYWICPYMETTELEEQHNIKIFARP